jgi:hypothetical protein
LKSFLFYFCQKSKKRNKNETQRFTFMKAEFIHAISGQVYFSIKEMKAQYDSVKRLLWIPTCMSKLYVAFGFTILGADNFREKGGNL